ncbi:MAG: radical SAM protein [Planctomycetota bacterium]
MRVLFVYPNYATQLGVSLGLASLSAVLRREGHETRLLNLNEALPPVPTEADVYAAIHAWEPGLVGFSCLSMQYAEARRLAQGLRARAAAEGRALPPLVVGGVHPTMVPEAVMADGVWDHVGVGECEDALARLVAAIARGERPDDIPNFLSWRGGARPAAADAGLIEAEHWRRNPVGEFPDLALLPPPDHELFATQRILDAKDGWFSILTSRGCPYRCTYCLNHQVVERYRDDLGRSTAGIGFLRTRPIAGVMEEIRGILARFRGVTTFILDDDLFTLNTAHALAFAEAYRREGFGVPWVVNSHVRRLAPDLARALAAGGCRIVKLGIESGSERVRREVLLRPMKDDDILATIATAEAAGIHTSGFVMLGLPGESAAERMQTVDFLARSGLGRFRTSLFYPFPGTDGHRMAVEGGYIDPVALGEVTDFTRTSALDFGPAENLAIEKLAACMPWFVNAAMAAHGEAPAARRYRGPVEAVLALDRPGWEAFRPRVRELDAALSTAAAAEGERHYALRYADFLGVRSDWFLAEEAAGRRITASAVPACHVGRR